MQMLKLENTYIYSLEINVESIRCIPFENITVYNIVKLQQYQYRPSGINYYRYNIINFSIQIRWL